MEYPDLLEKYNILLEEVKRLKNENRQLKANLGLREFQPFQNTPLLLQQEKNVSADESNSENHCTGVNNSSDAFSKIRLFMSIFKGRKDVYAKRWENKNKGSSGYSPVCLNQWQPGVCGKPKISCSK